MESIVLHVFRHPFPNDFRTKIISLDLHAVFRSRVNRHICIPTFNSELKFSSLLDILSSYNERIFDPFLNLFSILIVSRSANN